MKLKNYSIGYTEVTVKMGIPEETSFTKEIWCNIKENFPTIRSINLVSDIWTFGYQSVNDMETLLEGDIERVKKYLRKLK